MITNLIIATTDFAKRCMGVMVYLAIVHMRELPLEMQDVFCLRDEVTGKLYYARVL